MARPTTARRLGVGMNGERVGTWTLQRGGSHVFGYEDAWLSLTSSRPVSLSMPLRPAAAPYTGEVVEAYFDNLLPDSPAIRQRIQSRFGVASNRAFDLLAQIGRDCIGAVQLLPDGDVPGKLETIDATRVDDAGVADLLRGAVTGRPVHGADADADDFRISIAGAQEKTALLWHDGRWHVPHGATPTTHILKLPTGIVGGMRADFSTSVENEWLCAQIARAYGLPVADCAVATFEEQKALVVTRFDRRLAASGTHWLRLPQEDFCQATGTPPVLKYEVDGGPGIQRGMDLLLGSADAAHDRETFFKAQIVFWLLSATDGHAKNFSLHLEAGGRYRLTPLYDILSAYPVLGHGASQLAPERARMAMAVLSKTRHYEWSRILPRHWDATARRCGLAEAQSRDIRQTLGAMTPRVIEQVASQLPPHFPARVSQAIFDGISAAAARLVGDAR